MKNLPWLEIILVVILALMLVVGMNALIGRDVRNGIASFCTANKLWCAPPTPTPTITPTPTMTPLPTNTRRPAITRPPTWTPRPSRTPTPKASGTPTSVSGSG